MHRFDAQSTTLLFTLNQCILQKFLPKNEINLSSTISKTWYYVFAE